MVPLQWADPIPEAFSIVLTHFPYWEDSGKPSADIHPCLVLAKAKNRETGAISLFVAYGSSHGIGTASASNLLVDGTDRDISKATGLRYETRFDLSRVALLPYDHAYFAQAAMRRNPIIGRLPESFREMFNAARLAEEERVGKPLVPGRPRLIDEPAHQGANAPLALGVGRATP